MSTTTAQTETDISQDGKVLEYPDWQRSDVDRLVNDPDCRHNFSEMGCYKTTTGLRVIAEKCKDVENPNVLVVTTRTGKGTFFENAPKILPGWTLFNLDSKGLSVI